jgi:hypothetical protein
LLLHTSLFCSSPSTSGGDPGPPYDSNDDGPDDDSYSSDDGQVGGGVHSDDGFGAHGQADDGAYSDDEFSTSGNDDIDGDGYHDGGGFGSDGGYGRDDENGQHDPPWDAYHHGGFTYPPGIEALQHTHGPAMLNQGHTWQYYQCDPYDVVVDITTGQIPTWYASRPDHGVICNFPVPLDIPNMDQEQFLAAFQCWVPFFIAKEQKKVILHFQCYDPLLMSLAVFHGKVV